MNQEIAGSNPAGHPIASEFIMLITYASLFTSETLICTPKSEDRLLREWFTESIGRQLEDFERIEHPSGVIGIRAETRIRS